MRVPNSLKRRLARYWAFHQDESGESNTLTNIMMLAVAALVLIGLITFGGAALKWLGTKWHELTSQQPDAGVK